uniref:Alpha-methyldopa hypersensitive protein n=1 Tax=Cacopsylla melanoneura TaxID=428564 RepID=A0A8D8MFK2_9HEMI
MNSDEFRQFGKATVDYIADYMDTIRDRPVLPNVTPGYLATLVPETMPQEAEDWRHIMQDLDTVIMPGLTHWQSPQFHSYYPTASSYPAIVGDMLTGAFGVVGFNWLSSPVATELEVLVMNWLGKAFGLPEEFLNCSSGPGGGIIQGSASEATLVAILAAKRKTVMRFQASDPNLIQNEIRNKLVAYGSDQSNSSIEKSSTIGDVPMRLLTSDDNGVLRGDTFLTAVQNDLALGNIPCCLVATLGTTGNCAFDNLEELGPICQQYNIWLHVDAAYAGPALLLPEYQHLRKGLQYTDSFDFNAHKWLLVNFDCSCMWVKDANDLLNTFYVDRIYLKHKDTSLNTQAPDYMHWQIQLGRRFRALKLWMTLRVYGENGLRDHLRKQISLAKNFADLVQQDERFDLVFPASLGLACFRLKGDSELNMQLYDRLIARRIIYLVRASFQGRIFLRFAVCSRLTEQHDVDLAWNEILTATQEILSEKMNALPSTIEEVGEVNTSNEKGVNENLANEEIQKNSVVEQNKVSSDEESSEDCKETSRVSDSEESVNEDTGVACSLGPLPVTEFNNLVFQSIKL